MLNEKQRVVITGMGALSPVGNSVAEMWEGFVTGRQGVGFITLFDTAESEVKIAGEVKGFDPAALMSAKEARKLDRFAQLAYAAAKEALEAFGVLLNAVPGRAPSIERFPSARGPNSIRPCIHATILSDAS